ncbi:uroporphyrinogen decarboxylase family protein [Oscillatoria laete-virens NRMC-F 0139]|nr:uroporphyrinogen decarboxylase family protein [Oscillatoria laete-virens]MDL5053151.1 uroporphyrinogen decarboxylase family protein [Oscillatoria laete-virens NRMC-F 0139]
MNSMERVRAVISGEIPDRIPVCLHNFLHACHEAGIPVDQYRLNPRLIAEAHLRALEKYQYDCVLIDLDTTMAAEAMGAHSEVAPNGVGSIHGNLLTSLDDAARLKVIDAQKDGRIPILLEAIHLLKEKLAGQFAIRANCDQGPFSLAALLRGMNEFMMDLADDPDDPRIAGLLDICHQSHLKIHEAVHAAGATMSSLGDSVSGPDVLSPGMFRKFAKPHHERLLKELEERGIFTVIHICGNTTMILDDLAEYPFCGFELDYKTDAQKAKDSAGKNHVLLGNIDPSAVLAFGSPETVEAKTRELIGLWKPGGRFILDAGCAINANTPSENLAAMMRVVREEGIYV